MPIAIVFLLSVVVFVSAESLVCIDSDDGLNADVKGTTFYEDVNAIQWASSPPEPFIDTCEDDKLGWDKVLEGYCPSEGRFALQRYIRCKGDCVEGACVQEGSENGYRLLEKCEDSDEGKDYDQKGELTLTYDDGYIETIEDECSTWIYHGQQKGVTEYSCDMSTGSGESYPYFSSTQYPCNCVDGECTTIIQVTCEDSDTGVNYYEKGEVIINRGGEIDSFEDECIGENKDILAEYSCDEDEPSLDEETHKCPYGCQDGACIQEAQDTCTDSDNGETCNVGDENCLNNRNDLYIKGETVGFLYTDTNKTGTRVDMCAQQRFENETFVGWNYVELCEENCGISEGFCFVSGEGKITASQLEFECIGACNNGACLGEGVEIITPTEDSGPINLIAEEQNKEVEIPIKNVCNGCELVDLCYPLGYRKSGEYCSESKTFISQLEADSTCENNFECSTNLCIDSQCISSGFWQKIMNWFKRLF